MTALYTPSLTPSQQRAADERRARQRKIAVAACPDTPIALRQAPRPPAPAPTETAPRAARLPGLTVEHIQEAVAAHFGITRDQILSPSMRKKLTTPRHIAMDLTHRLLGYGKHRIGAEFQRDHVSVRYALAKIDEIRHRPDVAAAIDAVTLALAIGKGGS